MVKKKSSKKNIFNSTGKTKIKTQLKQKKKRGRKPKGSKVYDIDLHETLKQNRKKQDNLILHLNVKASDLADKKIKEPEAFDPLKLDTSIAQPFEIEKVRRKKIDESKKILSEIVVEHNGILLSKQLKSVLTPFQDFNKTNVWPEKTNIACYWCCHEFSTVPVPVPIKYEHNKFHVHGCFCSYNCAAAYIFDNKNYDMWNQYSLLNFLYKKLNPKKKIDKISVSPPKCVLKKFGGFASIEEYREKLIAEKSYNIIQPPMLSLVPQVEENSFVWTSKKDSSFLNFEKELVLQRSRPINKSKTTLMDYLNFK